MDRSTPPPPEGGDPPEPSADPGVGPRVSEVDLAQAAALVAVASPTAAPAEATAIEDVAAFILDELAGGAAEGPGAEATWEGGPAGSDAAGAPSAAPAAAPPPADGAADACWDCARCTYRNEGSSPRCEMCLGLRFGDEPQQAVQESSPRPMTDMASDELLTLRVPEGLTSMGWLPRALPPAPVHVHAVVQHSWAARHGVRKNDELVKVDGRDVSALSQAEMMSVLRRRPLELVFRKGIEEELHDPLTSDAEEVLSEAEIRDADDLNETWGSSFRAPSDDTVGEVPEDIAGEDFFTMDRSWRLRMEEGSDVDSRLAEDSDHDHSISDGERSSGSSSGVYESLAQPDGSDSEGEVSALLKFAGLPTHLLTEQDVEALPGDRRECSICLDDYRAGDTQLTLPCFHRFHEICARRWLHRSSTCPACKLSLSSGGLLSDEG